MTDQLLLETAERAFSAVSTFDAVQEAEANRWSPAVWDAIAEMGLPWISVPESAGGVGGTLTDAIAVLTVAGRYAAPIPLAETGLLGGWLLSSAGLTLGEGPLSVVPGRPKDTLTLKGGMLSGTAHRVPWAGSVEQIVALIDGQVVAVAPGAGTISEVANLAGEPRDTITFDGAPPEAIAPAPPGVDAKALRFRGALSRAALMAGALSAMSELTVSYTSERKQFGKPVGTFQAVQALLVRTGEEAALVDLAVQVAARETERGQGRFETASAKLLADDAARIATRAAHQAHGAMGMTQEYPLHQLSRRLWSWRAEFGDAIWPATLGSAVVDLGADDLYRAISEGSASGIAL
jgi:acyl-CoA dehydrogenase